MDTGREYSYKQLNNLIEELITPDFDSLEITGGEPLLHADYIKKFLEQYSYKAMLETNATIPENMEKLVDVISIVSMDIKLPEHFGSPEEWQNVYQSEIETIKVLESHNMDYYIKLVVSMDTDLSIIESIRDDVDSITTGDVNIIIQPVSPIDEWTNMDNLFRISELLGSKFSVAVIPQIHKMLNVE